MGNRLRTWVTLALEMPRCLARSARVLILLVPIKVCHPIARWFVFVLKWECGLPCGFRSSEPECRHNSRILWNDFGKLIWKWKTLFRHLRAVVLFYKKRRTVEKIIKTLNSKPLYICKALKSKPIRLHAMQLTQSFIEKARGSFDQITTVLPYPTCLSCVTFEDGKQVLLLGNSSLFAEQVKNNTQSN